MSLKIEQDGGKRRCVIGERLRQDSVREKRRSEDFMRKRFRAGREIQDLKKKIAVDAGFAERNVNLTLEEDCGGI
jgi:hypothetical protein